MNPPCIDEATRAAADGASARLSEALADPAADRDHDAELGGRRWHGQSLYRGAAGAAILHGVRAQAGYGPTGRVQAWLSEATREDVSVASTAGLWFGAPAIAFAIATAAPGQCPQTMQQLDTGIARLTRTRLDAAEARIAAAARPALAEYDLVRGLTGLGAYLLHRDPHGDLTRAVLTYLVRLTDPVPAGDDLGVAGPGWWSGAVPSGEPAARYPGGHVDLGIAHGISGPLALLALAMRRGITVPGHAEAIDQICRFMDRWRQDTTAGAWWPERIGLAELRAGSPRAQGPARPSWCYGTPGIARAQQLAAIALGDTTRQRAAELALARCLHDPRQLAAIVDARLCHGWAGLTLTAWYAAHDAATDEITARLPPLLRQLTMLAEHLPAPGRAGLIDGDAGVALTLHTLTTATAAAAAWPACLLIT
ncbi:lanthionine synthetase C family protein [Dactylosporangium sp. CA-139114]|uniref:lanthionine synthetase C family protein n=1 Tax=Dactylosporangium sp. CA-139114 TaxID=3239931 RepID=UPI003D975967